MTHDLRNYNIALTTPEIVQIIEVDVLMMYSVKIPR